MNIDFGMEKYVYKIENKINKKIYVGQTNNLDRRMQEHKHDERNNHPIHNAIKKYGWENFEVSVLYYGVNYNEKEKEYIKLYKSNRKEYGYNITAGGQDSSGENNPQSKLSQSDVYQIISDLKGNNSIECIAKKYRTTVKTIRNINAGISWRIGSLQYPIRKRKLKILNNEEVKEIISLLKDANNSIEGIADMFNIKPYIVLNDEYPIQASQFESDIRIAEQLDKIYFEFGGGGNSFESYTAAWYFGSRHTKLDCLNRGRKGIIITMGDERLNPYIPTTGRYCSLAEVTGDGVQGNIETKDLYGEVSEKFNVYHLDVHHGSRLRDEDGIERSFKEYLDNAHFRKVTIDSISDEIIDIVLNEAESNTENPVIASLKSEGITW